MEPANNRGVALLDRAYVELGLTEGALVTATESPAKTDPETWRRFGDWLLLASRVGIEKVFFVGDDPVVVFSSLPEGSDEQAVAEAYRRTWSLSRPRCLFLATGSDLRVYALTQPPAGEFSNALEPLEIVRRAADVADALANFRRERLESGAAFEHEPLRSSNGRADQRLISDVRTATDALVGRGLSRFSAHSLIERVILVRYLEDRGVLTAEYFEEVASARAKWQRALRDRADAPNFGQPNLFGACLDDLTFTNAVFHRLSKDFSGDLFAPFAGEGDIHLDHLRLVKSLLDGTAADVQSTLFLWAYDFSVVPTSLISSMYEMFHREETAPRERGAHYTPAPLAEYVLSQTLTESVLDSEPRVCDPACGSGIFLVEAYRLIVRHAMARHGRRLPPTQLRRLLLDRIAGVDVDEQAIRLASFSLYLALLNYQTPQDIRLAGPLPRLISQGETDPAPLVVADAFSPTRGNTEVVDVERLPWPSHHFDVVVGNPPWTEPRGSLQDVLAESWASAQGYPVGDRNPSQLFMWRTLTYLKSGGLAALLVGASALQNTRSTSRAFRRDWLERVELLQVINFSSVRRSFFSGSVAPFFMLRFRNASLRDSNRFVYQTVRPSESLRKAASMAFARVDRRVAEQRAFVVRDYLWKLYAWGGHRDEALLARLELESRLRDAIPNDPQPGFGYQRGHGRPSRTLTALRSLYTFEPWGRIRDAWLEEPPSGVSRQPDERLYFDQRLLVSRGVRAGFGPVSRLETQAASFRHTIYSIPLPAVPASDAKVLLGILLSSFGRYVLFMTSSAWERWHDDLRADDILDLPVRLTVNKADAAVRVTDAVDSLRGIRTAYSLNTEWRPRPGEPPVTDVQLAFSHLDHAIADLFELSLVERDLINDFWDMYLNPDVAEQRTPPLRRETGSIRDVAQSRSMLGRYLRVFLTDWNPRLGASGELVWSVVRGEDVPVLAIIFETTKTGTRLPSTVRNDSNGWQTVLDRLDRAGTSISPQGLFTHGTIRAVTDTSIIIVKRDERRLWTATAAREDAEAALLQAMSLEAA